MHIPPPRPQRGTAFGMTLVELLVALTLAVGLAALAFNLFGITQSAARSGIQRSTLVQQAFSAETRLRNDFANVIGPNRSANAPAGALLVVPGLRQGTLPIPGQGTRTMLLRSDQLVFFYDAQNGGLAPGSGTGQAMTSLTRVGVKSPQAKIWIGHVQRDTVESLSALDWTLGRQATLLVDPAPGTVASVASVDTALAAGALSPVGAGNDKLDVASFSLEEIANWMRARTPGAVGDQAMVDAFAVRPSNIPGGLPTVVTQPLGNADGGFTAADILGGHRIFLSHVSEIVVQYAVDDSFGMIRTANDPANASGPVKWYPTDQDIFGANGGPAQTAALAPKVFYPQDDQPRVVHLGYYQGPDASQYNTNKFGDVTPYPGFGNALAAGAVPTAAERTAYAAALSAYAAHHNGWRPGPNQPPEQSKWPRMIRIRYRLHDPDGAVGSVDEEFATNGRDNAFGVRCSGVWFEHVFAIPYPRVN